MLFFIITMLILVVVGTLLQWFAEDILHKLCQSTLSQEKAANVIHVVNRIWFYTTWSIGTYFFFTLFGLVPTLFAACLVLTIAWIKN